MKSPILEVKNLILTFPHRNNLKAIDDLSFSLKKGETLGIVGESGSGKSLTSLAIMQLLPNGAYLSPSSKIYYEGKDLLELTEKQMRSVRGKKISLVFQEALVALNPVLTIGQQLLEIILRSDNTSKKEGREKAHSLLDEVGIESPKQCFRSYPFELSGGMQQRCVIAIAIACKPDILIADEPTTALDVIVQDQILELFKKIQDKHKMSMVFISHDLAVVSQVADRVLILKKGKLVESGLCSEVFKKPKSDYGKNLLKSIPETEARQDLKSIKNNETLLNIEKLKVYFPIKKGIFKRTVDHVKAVDDVSFAVKQGETVGLVGQSGSGKTTAAMAVLSLVERTSGDFTFAGKKINDNKKETLDFLRRNMQVIFQDPYASLNPRKLVYDSMIEGLISQKKIKEPKEALSLVDELLEQVSLPKDAKWNYPHEFSGGEKQRICIARALTMSPKILVLDEPTSALDVTVQMQVLQLLEKLQKEKGLAYFLITHNLGVLAYLSHHSLVMYRGKIVEQGETKKILENPQHSYTQKLLAAMPALNLA